MPMSIFWRQVYKPHCGCISIHGHYKWDLKHYTGNFVHLQNLNCSLLGCFPKHFYIRIWQTVVGKVACNFILGLPVCLWNVAVSMVPLWTKWKPTFLENGCYGSGASDLAWIFTVIRSSQNVELTGNHWVISDTLFWGFIFDSDIIGEKNPSLIITIMQIIIKTANFTECLWGTKYCSKHVCIYMKYIYIHTPFVYMYVIIHLILIMGIAFHILFKKLFSTPRSQDLFYFLLKAYSFVFHI